MVEVVESGGEKVEEKLVIRDWLLVRLSRKADAGRKP